MTSNNNFPNFFYVHNRSMNSWTSMYRTISNSWRNCTQYTGECTKRYEWSARRWFYPAKTPNVLNGKCYWGENWVFQLPRAFECRCEWSPSLLKRRWKNLESRHSFGLNLTTWATSGWSRRNLSMTASILNSGKDRWGLHLHNQVVEHSCQMKPFFGDRCRL